MPVLLLLLAWLASSDDMMRDVRDVCVSFNVCVAMDIGCVVVCSLVCVAVEGRSKTALHTLLPPPTLTQPNTRTITTNQASNRAKNDQKE